MMEIGVLGQKKAGVPAAAIARAAKTALSFLSKGKSSLSVVIVDDTKIKGLNTAYRGKSEPTDVLSVGSGDKDEIGDIFISPVSAKRKAKERGVAYRDYMMFLVVHGVLHLCGHTHETPRTSAAMERLEREIMGKLNVKLDKI